MKIIRLFSSLEENLFDSREFVERDYLSINETSEEILAPEKWENEAVSIYSEALYEHAPFDVKSIEENTLPSWMWKRRFINGTVRREKDIRTVFNRISSSAAYKGWKSGLFSCEREALSFRDEINFMLSERILVLSPEDMKHIGLDWAYGITAPRKTRKEPEEEKRILLKNSDIDEILCGKAPYNHKKWEKILKKSDCSDGKLILNFKDTSNEWLENEFDSYCPRATIDLIRLKNDDKSAQAYAISQAARLSMILLELHYDELAHSNTPDREIAIGFVNMSRLLLEENLAYDSEKGRHTAAAISAIMSAEIAATSAELACALGVCESFAEKREAKLRAMRNQRRAAYGEHNDYERISIIPASLEVCAYADLILVAAARRRWDEALDLAQKHGLRNMGRIELKSLPYLPPMTGCATQGIEPESTFITHCMTAGGSRSRMLFPQVVSILKNRGYTNAEISDISEYACGRNTLNAAPHINHISLLNKGMDEPALSRIEAYIPHAENVRYVFTPWVVGERFCHLALRVPLKKLHDISFDLLAHLGFSEAEVSEANAYCYGSGKIAGAPALRQEDEKLFARQGAQQQIAMAAAVQSFVSSDNGAVLTLDVNTPMEMQTGLILSSWRQGLKSLTIFYEGKKKAYAPREVGSKLMKRKTSGRVAAAAVLNKRKSLAFMVSSGKNKPRASAKSVSIKRASVKMQSMPTNTNKRS